MGNIATPQSPGVYIFEVPPAQVPQGVSPSTMGIIGYTLQGPVNTPTLVQSFDEFVSRFGGLTDLSLVPLSVQAFFQNGGQRAYIVRVVPAGSVTADVLVDNVPGPTKWTIDAISPGAWGNNLQFAIAGDKDFLDTTHTLPAWTKFDVSVLQFDTNLSEYLAQEAFQQVDLVTSTSPTFLPTVVNDPDKGSQLVQVVEGAGGVPAALIASAITNQTTGAVGDGFTATFTGTLGSPRCFEGSLTLSTHVSPILTVTDDGFGHLIGNVDPSGLNTINYDTGVFAVTFSGIPASGAPIFANYTHLNNSVTFQLASGTDGSGVITRNQISNPLLSTSKQGIYAFNSVEDILNLVIPDFAGNAPVMQDLSDFCDTKQDRFAILTTPPALTPAQAVAFVRNTYQRNSKATAIYYPWVKMLDRNTNGIKTIPPLGHLAGIYANTDLKRTVAKAPAGVDDGQIQGIFATERKLERTDLDNLYSSRINPLFSSESTGDIVFGVRTLSLDPNWRYINVERLFMFVEKVMQRETQFAIFENNGPDLWTRISQKLTGILTSMLNAKMFAGATPDEAFFVTCDQTNNTPTDIASGVVNVAVGMAPQIPGEFILITVQQKQVAPTTT